MKTRPMGVTVVAIIAFFWGFLSFCRPLAIFFVSSLTAFLPGELGMAVGFLGILMGIIAFILPLLLISFGVGMWSMESWAWWLGMVLTGVAVVGVVVNILNGDSIAWAVWTSIVPILIFIYLILPKTRELFEIGS